MGIIAARRTIADGPRVNVSAPPSSSQVRIGFNPAQVDKAGLGEVTHVALDHDETKQRLKFIPSGPEYGGAPAHKLLHDGGKKTASRIVLVAKSKLGFLAPGSYEPHPLRGGKGFEIFYGAK